MTQSVVIQIGQCGNQIGYRFWDLALKEQSVNNTNQDRIVNSFFRFKDNQSEGSSQKNDSMKARAILIDMEEGVIREIMKSSVCNIFDSKQKLTDVLGSGNNWAVGFNVYGKKYKNEIEDLIRKESEMCDNLQCFFLLHSMGGGTGSGLGTYVLESLAEHYPKKYKFVTSVYPTSCDDVVTSPYNALLSNNKLIEHADCVFPVENKALADICDYISKREISSRHSKSFNSEPHFGCGKPFDQMNNIIANLLLDVTCSSRFEGTLNVDLNELVQNMIPYPHLHFLVSSISPLFSILQGASNLRASTMLGDLLSSHNCLFNGDLRRGTFLACALLARGEIPFSDIQKGIERLRYGMKFIPWNADSWKTGLCDVKPLNNPYSALLLSNNSALWQSFVALKNRFLKMYSRKAHLHHFLQVDDFESQNFDVAITNLDNIIEEYKTLSSLKLDDVTRPRMKILV